MRKWKNEVPEKKENLLLALLYFFSKLFSKFIECDHALSNSLHLFVCRVLILQGEI